MKRKADTTTTVIEPPEPIVAPSADYHLAQAKPAKIPGRRESSRRNIKAPNRELPESDQHQKGKKGKLASQLKYCYGVIKELMSKKHSVRGQICTTPSLFLYVSLLQLLFRCCFGRYVLGSLLTNHSYQVVPFWFSTICKQRIVYTLD